MTTGVKEERLMVSYLLGAATEEECVEVEARFLRDVEYLKQLRAREYELIDDYVNEEMPIADRRTFERRLLASPQGLEQVARARKLHSQLDQLASEDILPQPLSVDARVSLRERLRAALIPGMPAMRYAMAGAILLLLLGGLLLLRESTLSRQQIAQLTVEREALRQTEKNLQEQLVANQRQGQQLSSQLETERKQLDVERSRVAQMQEQARQRLTPPGSSLLAGDDFVELALSSGIERNPGEPRRLNIPADIRFVKLQLELDPSVSHRSYRVELNTAGGTQVWSQGRLDAQRVTDGRFVTLMIPSRVLLAGEYELILHGLTDERKSEIAGYYYFIASLARR